MRSSHLFYVFAFIYSFSFLFSFSLLASVMYIVSLEIREVYDSDRECGIVILFNSMGHYVI